MRPNSRETTTCAVCHASIFFAVTRAGERQSLDAAPHPSGPVMAYRGVRHWLARTLPRESSAEAGRQLALEAVDELVDDPRQHPPHPLEDRFMPHAATCAGAPPVQTSLFDGPSDLGLSVVTTSTRTTPSVPAPRRPAAAARRSSPLIYNVKPGASHDQSGAPQEGEAKVFEWDKHAPRVAARRRAARPAAGQ